jgi:hypothetical protein
LLKTTKLIEELAQNLKPPLTPNVKEFLELGSLVVPALDATLILLKQKMPSKPS